MTDYPDRIEMINKMVEITFKKFPSLVDMDPEEYTFTPRLYYEGLADKGLKAEYKINFIDQSSYHND